MINANIRLPPPMLIGQRGGNAMLQEGKRKEVLRQEGSDCGFGMICQTGSFGITVNNQN